jgi:glucose-1-phosphate thymidylyltransferase
MEIAKALILAGSAADERPWPVMPGARHLFPVANRPILFHNLAALKRAGMLEAMIAIEPEDAPAIIDAVGDGSDWDLSVRYVRWTPETGIGGALVAAREYLGDEPVLVGPGDALHRERLHPHIAAFADHRLDVLALTVPGAPSDADGNPVRGGYLLSHDAIGLLQEATPCDGELLAGVRRSGGHVHVREIDTCLPCHGDQDRLLEGNRRVLEDLARDVDPAAYPGCDFQGAVAVHPSARIDHTLVRGPAVIGPHARLSHAYVGPWTSIGAGVTIEGSQVEHSIVFDGARILHVGVRLETSVIGRDARISRGFEMPTGIRLSVGDRAEVTLA